MLRRCEGGGPRGPRGGMLARVHEMREAAGSEYTLGGGSGAAMLSCRGKTAYEHPAVAKFT